MNESGHATIPCLLRAADLAAVPEQRVQHQFNENAVRMTRSPSDLLGLARLGVHLVRLTRGRDSTTFHYHEQDEEFVYILSGRGVAEIGDQSTEIGPGDFMGFPAGSPPHMMRNPFAEDLVYLMGGNRNALDVVQYPRDGLTMIKDGDGQRRVLQTEALQPVHRTPSDPDTDWLETP